MPASPLMDSMRETIHAIAKRLNTKPKEIWMALFARSNNSAFDHEMANYLKNLGCSDDDSGLDLDDYHPKKPKRGK